MRSSMSSRFPVSASAVAGVLLALAPSVARSQVVVQNDTVNNLGGAAIQAGFVAGESAAAWLTSPCTGDITAVQVAWLSYTGTSGTTLGDSIRVFDGGTFPVPGAQVAILSGPVLTDGYFNEFALPTAVPVLSGSVFVVSFVFLDSTPPLGPSVVTDVDGCQPGKNGVFAIPPSSWLNLCLFGVSGDLAIRAVVQCDDALIFADGFQSGDTSAWSETVQ